MLFQLIYILLFTITIFKPIYTQEPSAAAAAEKNSYPATYYNYEYNEKNLEGMFNIPGCQGGPDCQCSSAVLYKNCTNSFICESVINENGNGIACSVSVSEENPYFEQLISIAANNSNKCIEKFEETIREAEQALHEQQDGQDSQELKEAYTILKNATNEYRKYSSPEQIKDSLYRHTDGKKYITNIFLNPRRPLIFYSKEFLEKRFKNISSEYLKNFLENEAMIPMGILVTHLAKQQTERLLAFVVLCKFVIQPDKEHLVDSSFIYHDKFGPFMVAALALDVDCPDRYIFKKTSESDEYQFLELHESITPPHYIDGFTISKGYQKLKKEKPDIFEKGFITISESSN